MTHWKLVRLQYLADIFSVWTIQDLVWVMRFQSPLVCADPEGGGGGVQTPLEENHKWLAIGFLQTLVRTQSRSNLVPMGCFSREVRTFMTKNKQTKKNFVKASPHPSTEFADFPRISNKIM